MDYECVNEHAVELTSLKSFTIEAVEALPKIDLVKKLHLALQQEIDSISSATFTLKIHVDMNQDHEPKFVIEKEEVIKNPSKDKSPKKRGCKESNEAENHSPAKSLRQRK